MPYHLKPGERVPAEIQRIVREEIESAVLQLRGEGESNRDEAIHEARKNMKKVRGVLRLVRPELGEAFRAENAFFRDVGQRLSAFRDAGAMLESFDALRIKYKTELSRGQLASIRRALSTRKKESEEQAGVEKVCEAVAEMLHGRAKLVSTLPLSADGFDALAPGLEATFRQGQRSLSRARKRPTPENYHEWRKRVKDHWYHVRLLEGIWDAGMPAYERRLKDLETWLGDDHNLVVLQERVNAEPGFYGTPARIALLVKLIAAHRKELHANALLMGGQTYSAKPRQFISQMRRMWQVQTG